MKNSNITFTALQLIDIDYLLRKAIEQNKKDISVLSNYAVSDTNDLISSISDENARLEEIRKKISVIFHGGV